MRVALQESRVPQSRSGKSTARPAAPIPAIQRRLGNAAFGKWLGTRRVQRAITDLVTGLEPTRGSYPDQIFFEYGSSTIPASEQPKIPLLATPPARALDLNGSDSEEGTVAGRTTLTTARVNTVGTALRSAGHTGVQTPHVYARAGEGNIQYRMARSVAVVPAGGTSSQPNCQATAANPTPEVRPCGGAFGRAFPIGRGWISRARSELAANTPAAQTHVARLFPGSAVSTLATRITSLETEYSGLPAPAHHQCRTRCFRGCDRDASMDPSSHMMTLCPGFLDGTSDVYNAQTLVHEALHATPGVTAIDNAYRAAREIDYLSPVASQSNTDSYVLLVLRVQVGGVPAGVTGPSADARGASLTQPQFDVARRALSWLEQWLLAADWDMQQLYGGIQRNVGRAGGWNPADDYFAETQHRIAPYLGLTDPGPAIPRAAAPTRDDQINVAGIWDRYLRMREAVWVRNITLERAVAPVTEGWAPGPGTSVTVDPAFFADSSLLQVKRLLRLLASQISGIPAARVGAYVGAADQIRRHFSSGSVGP